VPQPDRDAGSRDVTGRRFDLFHPRSRLVGPPGVQRRFGQVADQPARDDRMVRRARRIKEAFGGLVGVGSPARAERGEDPAELREGDGQVRPGRHRDALGFRGAPLGRGRGRGRGRIAAHPGDDRTNRLRRGHPLRLAQLGRQAPGLFRRGNGHAPVGDVRRHPPLQREHARQVPEPPLPAQTLDRLGQERGRDIERPHRHRGRPQIPGGVRIAVDVGRGGPQPPQDDRRLPERVSIGLDGQDPQVG